MIEHLRSWIMCISGTACVCAIALALAPEGNVKKTVKLVCGFALMLSIMSAFKTIDYSRLSQYIAQYKLDAEEYVSDTVSESSKQTRFIIEQECEAYILDKAQELRENVECVSVTAKWSEDGFWYPVSANITGDVSEEVRRYLTQIMEAELGIAKDKQTWSMDNGS
jgi:hypothetical protein